MRMKCRALPLILAVLSGFSPVMAAPPKPRPLMRDFMGLCVHTVQFKPDLYAPVTRVVRDYHPFKWDVGDESDHVTEFPAARNRVDWGGMYAGWLKAGYRIDADIMFDDMDPKAWRDVSRDAFAYGKAFARYFGPSGKALVESMEIGNEPGKYDDDTYRKLFEGMARGAREGDPKLRIATCAVNLGPSGRYSKSVDCLHGLGSLVDIVNIHIYPEVEGWPTWRRSYPEDPKINFLKDLEHVLAWRDQNAQEKEVWLTEFGYDASTKAPPPTGDFAKWQGSTELQQAEWIVRAYLVLAARGADRAYLYFFNDNDEPHVHGSSGLTRNFQPKPAFYAVAHLQKTLGAYRLAKVLREDAESGYLYEFQQGSDARQRVLVAWRPQGEARDVNIPIPATAILRAERMPLSSAAPEPVKWTEGGAGMIHIPAGEAPVYLFLK